jgi:hypothetical protein
VLRAPEALSVEAWPSLPEAIRAAMWALVASATTANKIR